MSKLLIAEHPLQVLPTLAVAIGLNEAILLQQLHYWLNRSDHTRDGRRWVHKTVSEWQAEMPFWCERTIKSVVKSLRGKGLLLAERLGRDARDRTLWYSIDYDAMDALTDTPPDGPSEPEPPLSLPDAKGKSCPMERATPAPSKVQYMHDVYRTETTTETTDREKQTRCAPPVVVEIPDWMPVTDWEAFLESRKFSRAPMSAQAQIRAIAMLGKLREAGDDPSAVLEQSIINGWKGLFPLRKERGGQSATRDEDWWRGIQ